MREIKKFLSLIIGLLVGTVNISSEVKAGKPQIIFERGGGQQKLLNNKLISRLVEKEDLVTIKRFFYGDIRMTDKEKNYALYCAVKDDKIEITRFLVEHGANVNVEIYGYNLLHIAAWRNSKKVAEFLIEHGVDVNDNDNRGVGAFNQRLIDSAQEIKDILTLRLRTVQDGNNLGSSPLEIAAIHNSKEVAEILIDHGADINKDKKSHSPLLIAYANDSKGVIEVLQKHGARL